MRNRETVIRFAIFGLLSACMLCQQVIAGHVTNADFEKFRKELDQAILKADGDPRTHSYHFVFAVCTAGSFSAEMSAAKDIIYRCLDGGLLHTGDRVSFLSFELTNWYEYWPDEPFDEAVGRDLAKYVKVEGMPRESWTELEFARESMEAIGGHDVDSALHTAMSHLSQEDDGTSAIIVVFQASNMLYQPSQLPASGKAYNVPSFPFRAAHPDRYAEMMEKATTFGFPVSSEGIQSTHWTQLRIPDPKHPEKPFVLNVWFFMPKSLKALSPLASPRTPNGFLTVRAVDSKTGHIIPKSVFRLDGDSREFATNTRVELSPGAYRLHVTAPGHVSAGPVAVRIPNYGLVDKRVILKPSKSPLGPGVAWIVVLLFLLPVIRWRVRPANEHKAVDLPLIWPFGYYVCAKLNDEPKARDLVLSEEYSDVLPPGRLVQVTSFICPWIRRSARGTPAKPVIGKASVDIEIPDSITKRLDFVGQLKLGLRIGVVRVAPQAKKARRRSPGKR